MVVVRLRHVKRVRSKGRTYWYHRITRERLPGDREERAARVLEINRTMKDIDVPRDASMGEMEAIRAKTQSAIEALIQASKAAVVEAT